MAGGVRELGGIAVEFNPCNGLSEGNGSALGFVGWRGLWGNKGKTHPSQGRRHTDSGLLLPPSAPYGRRGGDIHIFRLGIGLGGVQMRLAEFLQASPLFPLVFTVRHTWFLSCLRLGQYCSAPWGCTSPIWSAYFPSAPEKPLGAALWRPPPLWVQNPNHGQQFLRFRTGGRLGRGAGHGSQWSGYLPICDCTLYTCIHNLAFRLSSRLSIRLKTSWIYFFLE